MCLPDDLSVVGYDDIEIMGRLTTPVTTVRVRSAEIGRVAARLLMARLEGKNYAGSLESEPELIVRASSGPPPLDTPGRAARIWR